MTIGEKITMRIQIDNGGKDENNHRKIKWEGVRGQV